MRERAPRLPFTSTLRRLGFHRDGLDREPILFNMNCGDRTLKVQLYTDMNHRVSHDLQGRMSTRPTEFITVGGMLEALIHELTRLDHKPRN